SGGFRHGDIEWTGLGTDAIFGGVEAVSLAEASNGTLVAQADGWTFVILEAPLAESGYRLTAVPDLEAGDTVWYGNVSDGLTIGVDVVVETDGSITLSETAIAALPITFDAFVDDGVRGATAEQTVVLGGGAELAGAEAVSTAEAQAGQFVVELVLTGVEAQSRAESAAGTV